MERREVARLVKEAYVSTDDEYGEEEAIIWAEDFKFPEGLGARDAQRLAEAGSLKGAVEGLHAEMAKAGRLSEGSIRSLLSEDDEDFDKLMDLLRGVKILTSEDFEPNGLPPELRAKYVRMAPAVNRLMYDLYELGLVIIVPTEVAKSIPGIHFSCSHWARKKGKKCGRPIGDASAREEGSHPLNSWAVKQLVNERWGVIHHPTLIEIARMVHTVGDECGWDDIVIWKMDLKSRERSLCYSSTRSTYRSWRSS